MVYILSVFLVVGMIFMITSVIYVKTGLFNAFYHDVLGWHHPDNSPKWSDGCSTHAKCKWCGKDIMQDSQGNWF
jgi:hypothetical protein